MFKHWNSLCRKCTLGIGNLLKHFSVDFDVGIQENGFSIPRIGLGFLWTIEATNGMYFLADNEYVRQLGYSKVAEFHRENLR